MYLCQGQWKHTTLFSVSYDTPRPCCPPPWAGVPVSAFSMHPVCTCAFPSASLLKKKTPTNRKHEFLTEQGELVLFSDNELEPIKEYLVYFVFSGGKHVPRHMTYYWFSFVCMIVCCSVSSYVFGVILGMLRKCSFPLTTQVTTEEDQPGGGQDRVDRGT